MKKAGRISRLREAFRGRSRGFSLVEVTIAIALIGIIAVSIMSALSYATMVLMAADKQATAESLAKSQMEYVKNYVNSEGYISAENGGVATYEEIGEIPDGYSISSFNRDDEIVEDVIGIPWDTELDEDRYDDIGIQKVKLVISYEIIRPGNKVVEEQYILEGYIRAAADYTEV